MRLICPRCGAQYEIEAGAIPPAGRDVECSACEHVWRAMPETESFDPSARPSLSRPLSESVIEILREEAARELEVRAAERRTRRAAERAGELAAGLAGPDRGEQAGSADGQAPDSVADDADGRIGGREDTAGPGSARNAGATPSGLRDPDGDPATSVIYPVPSGGQTAEPSGHEVRELSGSEGETGREIAPATMPRSSSEVEVPRRAQPADGGNAALGTAGHRNAPLPVQAPVVGGGARARRRHAAGFNAAVMIALIAVALYALAPRVAGQGPLGETLAGWRAEVDRGRDWLSLQGDAVTDRLRRAFQGE